MNLNFLTPATLTLFLFFVVPGFVSIKVYDLLVPSEQRNFGNSIIEVIGFSIINLLPWSLILALMNWLPGQRVINVRSVVNEVSSLRFDLLPEEYAVLIGALFVSPALLTFVFFLSLSSPRFRKFVSLPRQHPTGWDHFFNPKEPCWILFHLKNEQKVGAYYGSKSSASVFPHVQQVYVEELYEVNKEGKWGDKPYPGTKGAIITREDCNVIELFTELPRQKDT